VLMPASLRASAAVSASSVITSTRNLDKGGGVGGEGHAIGGTVGAGGAVRRMRFEGSALLHSLGSPLRAAVSPVPSYGVGTESQPILPRAKAIFKGNV
jgi:hypothetical protein